jgi:hypothetical protein
MFEVVLKLWISIHDPILHVAALGIWTILLEDGLKERVLYKSLDVKTNVALLVEV